MNCPKCGSNKTKSEFEGVPPELQFSSRFNPYVCLSCGEHFEGRIKMEVDMGTVYPYSFREGKRFYDENASKIKVVLTLTKKEAEMLVKRLTIELKGIKEHEEYNNIDLSASHNP